MSFTNCHGCNEYMHLSRRQFLQAAGGAAAFAGLSASLPRVALANDYCSSRDVIISVYLRGAADGLTLCVPHFEPAYYAARPTLAVPPPDSTSPNRATDLDGFFGLPPAMTSLLPAFQAGHLLFVHACGTPDFSRSHFDAQRIMEVGKPNDSTIFNGWLARHLLTSPPSSPSAILRALQIDFGLRQTLQGAPLTIPVPNLGSFGLAGSSLSAAARRDVLDDLYAAAGDPLRSTAASTQATIDLLNQVDFAGYVPGGGAIYPGPANYGFGYAMKSTAALIKADIGVEAVAIDIEGWDTHGAQQPFTGGYMYEMMRTLSQSLAAFHADVLMAAGRNVTIVVMTEFGRRLDENGSLGTDHGHGSAMLLLGRDIAGGRVLTQWPGLAPEQLFQGIDLAVTTDWRDILAEVVAKRLGNNNLATIFPDYTPTFRGVTTACSTGDLNCDGAVTAADAEPFAQALLDPAAYQAAHPTCNRNGADVNADGVIDGRDVQALAHKIINP